MVLKKIKIWKSLRTKSELSVLNVYNEEVGKWFSQFWESRKI